MAGDVERRIAAPQAGGHATGSSSNSKNNINDAIDATFLDDPELNFSSAEYDPLMGHARRGNLMRRCVRTATPFIARAHGEIIEAIGRNAYIAPHTGSGPLNVLCSTALPQLRTHPTRAGI